MIKIITPSEVEKLPSGSKVREHALSRHGYPMTIDLIVGREKGKTILTYEGVKRKIANYKPHDTYNFYELLEVEK